MCVCVCVCARARVCVCVCVCVKCDLQTLTMRLPSPTWVFAAQRQNTLYDVCSECQNTHCVSVPSNSRTTFIFSIVFIGVGRELVTDVSLYPIDPTLKGQIQENPKYESTQRNMQAMRSPRQHRSGRLKSHKPHSFIPLATQLLAVFIWPLFTYTDNLSDP